MMFEFDGEYLVDAIDTPIQRRTTIRTYEPEIKDIFERAVVNGIEGGLLISWMSDNHIRNAKEAFKQHLNERISELVGFHTEVQVDLYIRHNYDNFGRTIEIHMSIGGGRWLAERELVLSMSMTDDMLDERGALADAFRRESFSYDPVRENVPTMEREMTIDRYGNRTVEIRRQDTRKKKEITKPLELAPPELFTMDD